MLEDAKKASDLNHEETAKYVVDLFHRTIIHHALWFSEVKHQMGMEKALEVLHTASKKSYEIQMKHLGALFGFEMMLVNFVKIIQYTRASRDLSVLRSGRIK